jgi:nucleotide-binding universal stress UspA family protein
MRWREVSMKKIEKILVPTDLSERSLAGVGYALNLSKELGAELTVLHVLGHEEFLRYGEKLCEHISRDPKFRVPEPYLQEYQLALKRFLAHHFSNLLSSVHIREQVEVGDLDEEIVSEAKKQKADLVVLAGRQRNGLARFIRADLLKKIARKAPCPVLTIRLEDDGEKRRAA